MCPPCSRTSVKRYLSGDAFLLRSFMRCRSTNDSICLRSAWFGISSLLDSASLVIGSVLCRDSHCSIAYFSSVEHGVR